MSSVVLVTLLVALLSFELLFQLLVLKLALPIFESPPPFAVERHTLDPTAEPVAAGTSYGLRLQGSLFRTLKANPRGLVLFCHELHSDRWSALAYCEGLLAAGFHVLAFDFRNHGDSDHMAGYEPLHWLTSFEVDDVLSALAYVNSRADLKYLPLGIFGVSRGGGAALAAASRSEQVRCVAADGAYSCNEMLLHYTARWGRLYFPDRILRMLPRWHVLTSLWLIRSMSQLRRGCRYTNIEQALSRLRGKRVLMMSGERDTYVIPSITLNLHARTGQDDSGVWIVPGAKHNTARQTSADEYDTRLVNFFAAMDGDRRPLRSAAEGSAGAGGLAAARPVHPSGSAAN